MDPNINTNHYIFVVTSHHRILGAGAQGGTRIPDGHFRKLAPSRRLERHRAGQDAAGAGDPGGDALRRCVKRNPQGPFQVLARRRLFPHTVIHEPIPESDCEKFQACFFPGVIDIVTTPSGGAKTCVVKNPRNDSVSRQVLRPPEFEGKVTLGRVRSYFIFNVESMGRCPPQEIPLEACNALLANTKSVRASLKLQMDVML
ncbi:hypothetical protein PCANC_13129 [Puccinia coronata f. sp. avenae]|uniref:Uncharacterized protein n=1 Tax=Puccinia coronata f. sp. avenae TaxID=200324 RepID=A0A2N5UWB2_9BASI|nr:hypothetical protein PCANC_13129 [Puccinia coronata f. sp. avenae]